MKKLVSVGLILALLLSLCLLGACSEKKTEEETPAPVEDVTPEETAPAEEPEPVAEPDNSFKAKLEAGEEVIVGCVMLADVPVLMETWAGQIKDILEPEGITVNLTNADGDMARMISQIENFLTMGAACIITVPTDAASLGEIAQTAMDQGVQILTWGVEESDYTICCRNDSVGKLSMQADIAAAWLEKFYPEVNEDNKIKVALFRDNSVADKVISGDALAARIDEFGIYDNVFTQVGDTSGMDDSFIAGENALTYDPDIRVFFTHQYTAAMGISNYVMAQPELNPAEFGAFSCDEDSAAIDMIDNMSASNESIFRGTAIPQTSPGVKLGEVALQCVMESVTAPRLFQVDILAHTDGTYEYSL